MSDRRSQPRNKVLQVIAGSAVAVTFLASMAGLMLPLSKHWEFALTLLGSLFFPACCWSMLVKADRRQGLCKEKIRQKDLRQKNGG
ncbi:MAG: hypothetical protein JSS02_01845 [Planctomycetes bacterium]|nr:hypothetical protein [Planctomycetota bacterium]